MLNWNARVVSIPWKAENHSNNKIVTRFYEKRPFRPGRVAMSLLNEISRKDH